MNAKNGAFVTNCVKTVSVDTNVLAHLVIFAKMEPRAWPIHQCKR